MAAWKTVSVSVRGTAHELTGSPCQDASADEVLGPDDDVVILALSDGAGSAKLSEYASTLIADSWLLEFRKIFADNPTPSDLVSEYTEADCLNVLAEIRSSLMKDAEKQATEINEFSATFLGAVITRDGGFVAQIGDGAWVAKADDVIGCVTTPTEGEFVGQTMFLTSMEWRDAFQFVRLTASPEWLIGFTDGMQRLALDSDATTPSPKFFEPLVTGVLTMGEDAETGLAGFLASDRVCFRTDDDKSFAMLIDTHASIR